MQASVATNDPAAVEREVQATYLGMFPGGDRSFVPRVFGWTITCFAGGYRDYQAVDTRYHDLEHTLQGTICLARLLRGRQAAAASQPLSQRVVELAILAILLHDTGYLKRRNDTEGTGAKYTTVHVSRSADFAAELLSEKGFGTEEIKAVQHMISCTGINANLAAIPFQSPAERVAGYALATADLLGQMAAEDYVEKLPTLYAEFAEAARYTTDKTQFVAQFSSAADLIARTPAFWDDFVLPKLERDLGSLHRFLNDPYPDGPNSYLQRIHTNIQRLRRLPSQT